ncbi:MAG: FHA domain-containing protein, partial [Candidatus Methylomirabilota bacterium]
MPILRIKVLTGPMKGTDQRFDRFPVTIGRSPENALPISGDDRISRAHARIRHIPPNLLIEDLQSRNGTFVEETRLTEPLPISAGKVVRVGHTLLQFEVEGMGVEVAGLSASGSTPKSLVEAVLVLDLCDSTTIANRYGDAFALELKEALRALVKPIFTRAHVNFLKGTGDGFLATFPDLAAAVESAIRILHGKADALPRPNDGRIPMLRFGIHFGQTHIDSDGDRQGDVINMAFRLEGAGTSGFHETRGGLEKDSLPLQ